MELTLLSNLEPYEFLEVRVVRGFENPSLIITYHDGVFDSIGATGATLFLPTLWTVRRVETALQILAIKLLKIVFLISKIIVPEGKPFLLHATVPSIFYGILQWCRRTYENSVKQERSINFF